VVFVTEEEWTIYNEEMPKKRRRKENRRGMMRGGEAESRSIYEKKR
jgi:hypothetical protein